MLSLTTEYALRAMVYLTQHADEWPISGKRIAEEAEIPRKYLSSILGDLVRVGVLTSARGAGGGFRVARSPKDVRLAEVFAPFEPILSNRRPCPFGNELCNDDDPCSGHEQWKKVRGALTCFLEETSLDEVSIKRSKPRKRAARRGSKR